MSRRSNSFPTTFYGLEDVADMLRDRLSTMDAEAGLLESVESRLDLINRLKRKYDGDLSSLFKRRDDIEAQLLAIDHLDDGYRDAASRN